MGRHRVPGEPAVARLTRALRPDPDLSAATPATRREARRRGSRLGPSATRPLLVRVAAQPWLTLVLLALVVVVGLSVLRPDTYAATTTVTATDERAVAAGDVALTSPGLLPRVEEAVELDDPRRGRLHLSVAGRSDRPELLVTAHASDPRLAAVAADTAAALVVSEHADTLTLSGPATVPTRPVDRLSPWWAVGGLTALALALALERLHERWEMRHTRLRHVAEGAA